MSLAARAFVLACVCLQAVVLAYAQLPLTPHHDPGIGSSPSATGSESEVLPPHSSHLYDIQSQSSGEFTTLQHSSFPHHQLRIKHVNDFCDPTVNVFSGYLDFISAGSKHLFFWFFESRSDPQTDDVIMWINGGPGAASGLGAFMELGPCSIELESTGANRTRWNPHSWNTNANVFFLDQPVGVGFSYADNGVHVYDTPEAARDVEVFVNLFFEVFEEFKARPFHLAGESHGGRYVPLFASEIYDGRTKAIKEGRTPVNLQSIMIGNGFTNPVDINPTAYDIACTPASGYAPVVDIETCVQMRHALDYFQPLLQSSCVDTLDVIECTAATNLVLNAVIGPLQPLNLNPYDIRKECATDFPLCFKEFSAIEDWLNLNGTRRQLGVPDFLPPYAAMSRSVNDDFRTCNDELFRSDLHVAQLLERGVRALIYVGVTDTICSWIGNNQTFSNLEWSGQAAFLAAPTRLWHAPTAVDPAPDAVAGTIRSANGLTFMTINEAGHMVPFDQPVAALTMLQAWIKKELA